MARGGKKGDGEGVHLRKYIRPEHRPGKHTLCVTHPWSRVQVGAMARMRVEGEYHLLPVYFFDLYHFGAW